MQSIIKNLEELKDLLRNNESENLEFKKAENTFSHDKAVKYCCAIANEKGGHFILGVDDVKNIVGTKAFESLQKIKTAVRNDLNLSVEISEIYEEDKRVLVFNIPSRPIGTPLKYQDIYWTRCGEELVAMTADKLRRIFDEAAPDFSGEICKDALLSDLSEDAISIFRSKWHQKEGKKDILKWDIPDLLENAELTIDGFVTYAALILLGTHKSLGRFLSCAETVFEYRTSETSIPYQDRVEYREGYLLWFDHLWNKINSRNNLQQYRSGLLKYDIPMFNEDVIREAILNAICHRDYRHAGNIFVRQYQSKITIESPGGFPFGITSENLLFKQLPRNRRLADGLKKCGFIERSGQGADLMFQESIKEGKSLPDYSQTDENQVVLNINGQVKEESFLRFLEKIEHETFESFGVRDFIVLDLVYKEKAVSQDFNNNVKALLDRGIIEKSGRKFMLSRKYYAFVGKQGVYTRRKGLDEGANKELLYKHIKDNSRRGSTMTEFQDVLPNLDYRTIQRLLKKLKEEGRVYNEGQRRWARWYTHSGAPK
jgi:ATP-dependent DNA helicase RecG